MIYRLCRCFGVACFRLLIVACLVLSFVALTSELKKGVDGLGKGGPSTTLRKKNATSSSSSRVVDSHMSSTNSKSSTSNSPNDDIYWHGGEVIGDGENSVDSHHMYGHRPPNSKDVRDKLLSQFPVYDCRGMMISGQDVRYENGANPHYKERNPKFLCDVDRLQAPCVVYSFGSFDEISFEVGFDRITNSKCEVHVFDPNRLPDEESERRYHFTKHAWGIAAADGVDKDKQFKTLATVMRELNHSYVDIMKIDVERAEEKALPPMKEILRSSVGQIAIEMHTTTWIPTGLRLLQDAGFRMVFARREDRCGRCTEITVVKEEFIVDSPMSTTDSKTSTSNPAGDIYWRGGEVVGDGEYSIDSHHLYGHRPPDSKDRRDQLLSEFPVYNCRGMMVSGQDVRYQNGANPFHKEKNPKFLCDVDRLQAPCVMYSFGSFNEISFEVGFDRITESKCQVHVFDPFTLPDEESEQRYHFTRHAWGIGASDGLDKDKEFKTLATIMKLLNHSYVDVLKIDVEKAEEKALPPVKEILQSSVGQIAIEIHTTYWIQPGLELLQDAGFRMVFARREDRCISCTEITMVKEEFIVDSPTSTTDSKSSKSRPPDDIYWHGGEVVGDGENSIDSHHMYGHRPPNTNDVRDKVLTRFPVYECRGLMISGQDVRYENGANPHYKERNPKFLCDVDRLQAPCVVYSFGSFDEISFEVGFDRITNSKCQVHVFDPNRLPDAESEQRYHFTKHAWGIAAANGVDKEKGWELKTLATVMKELNHSYVDILKIDVERAEEKALPPMKEILRSSVGQIAIEMHTTTWIQPGLELLQDAGFRMVFARREDRCGRCTEVTMVKEEFLQKS